MRLWTRMFLFLIQVREINMTIPTIQSFFNDIHSKEEVMDFVEEKLLQQGQLSLDDNRCKYHGDNGCKCAIGHLIPDDRYTPLLDDNYNDKLTTLTAIISNFPRVLQIDEIDQTTPEFKEKLNFLQQLQYTHDDLIWQEIGKRTDQETTWTPLEFEEGIRKNMNSLRKAYNIPIK